MPNIAKVFKEEITRLARIEVRANLERTRKAAIRQQRQIATLKLQVKTLERQVSALEKQRPGPNTPPVQDPVDKQTRFVPKGLVSTRKRLGLSASELGKLMGVSVQTVYNWERGATRPRPEQRVKLASLRNTGKRQIREHLAAQQA